MKQEFEIIAYPKIKHVKIFVDEVMQRNQHFHSDYEFCFVLRGSAIFQFSNMELHVKEKDVVFASSNSVHAIYADKDTVVGLFIQISNRFLKDYLVDYNTRLFEDINLGDVLSKEELEEIYNRAIRISTSYFKENELYRFEVIDFLLDLLKLVYDKVPSNLLSKKSLNIRERNTQRLRRIIDNIDTHFQEHITLNSIAKIEGLTVTHLSHLISDGLGINFQDYINNKRLECAARLLKENKLGIVAVAYEAGFSDPKYQTKLFKERFNCTPKEFRESDLFVLNLKSNRSDNVLERIYSDYEALKFFSNL